MPFLAPVLAALLTLTVPQQGAESSGVTRPRVRPVPVVIEPKPAAEVPGSPLVYDIAIAPDNQTLYVAARAQSVDLWGAAVSVWKEVLGGLALLVTLVTVLFVLRVRARPQVAGHPHCRRCNYDVIDTAPAVVVPKAEQQQPRPCTRCPECGIDLSRRPPRRGRSTARRIVVPATLGAAVVMTYSIMVASGLPRQGRASIWLSIFSETVDRWATTHQWTGLLKHMTSVTRVYTARVSDGGITARLATRRAGFVNNMKVSPDGRWVVLAEDQVRLACLSTRTGRCAALLAGLNLTTEFRQPSIIAYGVDGVVYSTLDSNTRRSMLERWDPVRGTRESLVDELAFAFVDSSGQPHVTARHYFQVNGEGRPGWASASSFYEAEEHGHKIRVYSGDGCESREIDLSPSIPPYRHVHVTCLGEAWVACTMTELYALKLAPGASQETVRVGMFDAPTGQLSSDGSGRLLFVSTIRSVLVYDLKSREWIARLPLFPSYTNARAVPSTDGRWLATTCLRSGGPGSPPVSAIVCYDLKPLQDYLAGHPATDDAAPR